MSIAVFLALCAPVVLAQALAAAAVVVLARVARALVSVRDR